MFAKGEYYKGDYMDREPPRKPTRDEWDKMTKEEVIAFASRRTGYDDGTAINAFTESCECSDWSQITFGQCRRHPWSKCKKRGHEVHNHIAAAIKRGEMAAKIYYEGNWIMPGGETVVR
jgi:hypothetical protein